ncbi:hypothetical protein [Halomonas sp. THAF12]|uniref:hypothetical protein n=1 Tax=Halomonas sp. THAF12 TaxID=2587849 RepID=UPI001562B63A|nr:hypothetical protein [Halomonas sp. THAF12]
MKYLVRVQCAVRHPLTKRAGLGCAIAAGISVARWWLGYEASVVIGFLSGLAGVAGADLILSDRDTLARRWATMKHMAGDYGRVAIVVASLLAVMALAMSHRQTPDAPLVQDMQSWVEVLGLLGVALVPPIRYVLGAVPSLVSMLAQYCLGLTGYAIALWGIGAVGDETLQWVAASPGEAAALAATAVICRWILQASAFSFPFASAGIAQGGNAAESMASARLARAPLPQTPRDSHYTAAHEAGHALVFAALGGLPADMKVVVNAQAAEGDPLGFVTALSSKHRLHEKAFAEWYMLVFLAGRIGEEVIHGESTLGSGYDHQRWLSIARQYLACHYRGMYYPAPETRWEHEHNDAQLIALQAEQTALVRTLFEMNMEVFKALTDTLIAQREMSRDDLSPLLSRVWLPEEFPLPLGPFDRFGRDVDDV